MINKKVAWNKKEQTAKKLARIVSVEIEDIKQKERDKLWSYTLESKFISAKQMKKVKKLLNEDRSLEKNRLCKQQQK